MSTWTPLLRACRWFCGIFHWSKPWHCSPLICVHVRPQTNSRNLMQNYHSREYRTSTIYPYICTYSPGTNSTLNSAVMFPPIFPDVAPEKSSSCLFSSFWIQTPRGPTRACCSASTVNECIPRISLSVALHAWRVRWPSQSIWLWYALVELTHKYKV